MNKQYVHYTAVEINS